MRINFWQIVGIALLLLGVVGLVYEKYFAGPTAAPPATTMPATMPTTIPLAA